MNDFIGVYQNALPSYICDELVQWSNKVRERTEPGGRYVYRPGNRIDYALHPHRYGSFIKKYKTIVEASIRCGWEKYCDAYTDSTPTGRRIGKFDINFYRSYKLQTSEPPDGGFVDWHCEQTDGLSSKSRFAVWMIYLNSLKDSGHTEFLFQNLKVLPEKGTLVIWPAAYTHLHRASPVLNEKKYILTGWFNYND